MFSCSCPLEIRALPYIDNKCNVGKYDYNNNNNDNDNDYNNDNDGDDDNNNWPLS